MDLLSPPTAALFPGQGVALGSAGKLVEETLPELAAHAAELAGADVFACAAESTRYAQPAVFLAGLASWTAFGPGLPLAMAGHSLGEITALCAAGALAPEDGLHLVMLRGRLMARAAETGPPGGMLAVLGAQRSEVGRLADRTGLMLANDNAPGQIVLSGPRESVERATVLARAERTRVIALDVGGAFHSAAMAPAVPRFAEALGETRWSAPAVPVISSTSARPFADPASELALALTRPVRWRETMERLRVLGASRYLDAGPDRVLARLVARNQPGAEAIALEELSGARS